WLRRSPPGFGSRWPQSLPSPPPLGSTADAVSLVSRETRWVQTFSYVRARPCSHLFGADIHNDPDLAHPAWGTGSRSPAEGVRVFFLLIPPPRRAPRARGAGGDGHTHL